MHVTHAQHLAKRPSSLHRTLGCPGWAQFCAGTSYTPSDAAIEGTAIHNLAEICLRDNSNVNDYIGVDIGTRDGTVTMTETMVDCAHTYVEYCRSLKRELINARVSLEARVDLNWLIPGVVGTVDYAMVVPTMSAHIVDLKSGAKYVSVGAKAGDNPQLSAYALAYLGPVCPVIDVNLTIVQPRCFDGGDNIRTLRVNPNDLYTWGHDVLKPGIQMALKDGAPRIPGGHCSYCPGEATCPELRERNLGILSVIDEDIPATSTDQLMDLVDTADQVKSWLRAVESELKSRVLISGSNDRYKCVQGLSNRAYTDEIAAATALQRLMPAGYLYTKKLLSPAKVEKALVSNGMSRKKAKDVISKLVVRNKTAPKLVKASKGGKALPAAKDTMFK